MQIKLLVQHNLQREQQFQNRLRHEIHLVVNRNAVRRHIQQPDNRVLNLVAGARAERQVLCAKLWD